MKRPRNKAEKKKLLGSLKAPKVNRDACQCPEKNSDKPTTNRLENSPLAQIESTQMPKDETKKQNKGVGP
jgi:hypothetical protein